MSAGINPIVESSAIRPEPRPGCVVVVVRGGETSELYGHLRASRQRASDPAAAKAGEPIFNEATEFGRRLSVIGKAVADTGLLAAQAGGRQLGAWLKRSRLGATLLGVPDCFFLVDIGQKRGELAFEVDSASHGIAFSVTLYFKIRVRDAVKAVELGISDLCAYHESGLRARISKEAIKFSANKIDAARVAFLAPFAEGWSDAAVEISEVSLRVAVDPRALELLRTVSEESLRLRALRAQASTDRAEREGVIDALSSPEAILAAWVSTKDERYRKIYEDRIGNECHEQSERLRLLDLAVSKGLIEAHDLHARYPDLAERLMPRIGNASASGSSAPSASIPPGPKPG